MKNAIQITSDLYQRFVLTGTIWLGHLFLLAVRIVWGWQFFQAGKGKLGDISQVTGYFKTLGIPLPKLNAIVASNTECFGGLLLLLGLGSRLISLPLTITMIVAYITADREAFGSLDKFVAAAPFPFLMASLIVLFFGPGFFSVDRIIRYFVDKNKPA